MGCDHQSCVPVGPFAGELWHFEYFPTTTVRQLLIFDHMTVIAVLTCCCIPNFIKIGSRVRPPDGHNCWMSRAPLLGSGRCHGNRIVGTCRGHDKMWLPKLGLSRSIGRRVMTFQIFYNIAAVRHFEFKKKLIFDHVTVILVLTCCCVPNFINIGSRIWPPDAICYVLCQKGWCSQAVRCTFHTESFFLTAHWCGCDGM